MRLIFLIVLCLCLIANIPSQPAQAAPLADRCPVAPSPRLRPGMAALVTADGLNLRALPAVDTGVNGRLYGGARLTVLSGPSCNGHLNWWRVETENGQRGWAAEGTWEATYIIPAGRAGVRVPTPVEWTCLPAFRDRLCFALD
ncbi:MAG: SH3 domain-containing protein [bacterium]|nr:SH3 domain-containing protein [bacterium]